MVPTPLSLSLLTALASKTTTISPEPREYFNVPVVEVENDIEINLISSSSDSYVQSDEEPLENPVFESRYFILL